MRVAVEPENGVDQGVTALRNRTAAILAGAAALLNQATGASAAEGTGAPQPWQLGFQEAATPVMERISIFHDGLLILITLISLLVFGLLGYVMWRFSEKRNPTPSRTAHNTLIEVLWTAIPVIILVIVAVPSMRLLYLQDVVPEADMTIKATGSQWYWSYAYPDNGGFEFDAVMVADEDIKEGQLRLLTTDNVVMVPVGATVRLQVAAADVLHSWAVPAFGVKIDAVPGRINEKWFRVEREGTFYGQCSELCGIGHGFMPIMVKAVSQEAFDRWVVKAQKEFATDDEAQPEKVAQARPAAE
jgi:cytochrome c oxidase subunit II